MLARLELAVYAPTNLAADSRSDERRRSKEELASATASRGKEKESAKLSVWAQ